jgi:hypothetical protein
MFTSSSTSFLSRRFATLGFPAWLTAAVLLCIVLGGYAASAQTITVNNQLANHYSYDPFTEACPSGMKVNNIPSGYHIERPNAIFNSASNQWVLWAHYDNSNYTAAEALVATSSSQCGPYNIYQEFQPLGKQIRDDFLFKDTNGTAYFIAASNKNGGANDTLAIFKLTSNYLDVDSSTGVTWAFENLYREAPIVAKQGSTYFLLTSQAAGWFPSQGGFGTSSSMTSGWSGVSPLGNPATFGGQESGIKVITGSSTTSYILVMDHLGGNTARDDGDLWLPLTLNGSAKTASLVWHSKYTVNLGTGVMSWASTTDLAHYATATASATASGSSPTNAADALYTTQWAAPSSAYWPAWWQVDLGSVKSIGQVNIAWPMTKGSEAYMKYKIDYSNDGVTYTTLDHTNNQMYGFTSDTVNISARYVKIELITAVIQNNPNNWYTPALWEVQLLGPQ